ncbi:hypothetical protein QEG98_26395 [Myxococcus sp. MxC21-1]|nr:hypothetical protein QEG98_26395 [Myxococcus sp. MxC21-1]
MLAEMERWPELAQHIEREIQLADERGAQEEASDLRVRLGRLKVSRLDDPRGALELYQAVLARREGHAGAVGALEEMARSESPLRGAAASALEPVFASVGNHLKQVEMLESRASAEAVPQERAALLRRIAEIYAGSLENAEMGFLAATRALRELPDDLRSLELCVALVDKAEAPEELAAILTEVVGKAGDASRAELYRALARIQTDLGEPPRRWCRGSACWSCGPRTPKRWMAPCDWWRRRASPRSCWRCCAGSSRWRRTRCVAPRCSSRWARCRRSSSMTRWARWPPSGACWKSSRTTCPRWSAWRRSARSRSAGRNWRTHWLAASR